MRSYEIEGGGVGREQSKGKEKDQKMEQWVKDERCEVMEMDRGTKEQGRDEKWPWRKVGKQITKVGVHVNFKRGTVEEEMEDEDEDEDEEDVDEGQRAKRKGQSGKVAKGHKQKQKAKIKARSQVEREGEREQGKGKMGGRREEGTKGGKGGRERRRWLQLMRMRRRILI